MAAAIGTGLLWFGWFGFNTGGALRANEQAATAFVNTFVALAAAMVVWMIYAKVRRGNVTFLDVLTGSIAGLATITPCAGYVKPFSALVIGLLAGIICNLAVEFRQKMAWDDALDVWGVHGIGGFTGTILIGIFATTAAAGDLAGIKLVAIQLAGAGFVAIYAFAITTLILRVLKKVTVIETTEQEQLAGLDVALLHETTYEK